MRDFVDMVFKKSSESLINSSHELIIKPEYNIYLELNRIESKLDLKMKVLSWLSRPSFTGVSKKVRTPSYLVSDDEKRIIRIIRAQLSTYELLVIYDNGATDQGSKMGELAVNYNLFRNMNYSLLISESIKISIIINKNIPLQST